MWTLQVTMDKTGQHPNCAPSNKDEILHYMVVSACSPRYSKFPFNGFLNLPTFPRPPNTTGSNEAMRSPRDIPRLCFPQYKAQVCLRYSGQIEVYELVLCRAVVVRCYCPHLLVLLLSQSFRQQLEPGRASAN